MVDRRLPSAESGAEPGAPQAFSEVAAALSAINRASRSFSLYDARNAAVTRLVADYREKTSQLSRRAPLSLDVLPFEIRVDGVTVYEEADRERSLSYRLFRDGIRRLHFKAGVGWPDMVRLLEALSIRASTMRQQEDDLLTLLRKADLQHIQIEAVEGYTPDEENPEASLAQPLRARQPMRAANDDWDQPLPEFGAGDRVEARAVPAEAVAALRAEEHPTELAAQAVRGVTELLRTAQHLCDRRLAEELEPFAHEVADYLLFDKRLDQLLLLANAYAKARESSREPRPRLPVLLSPDALDKLVSALSADREEVPPAFFELLELVGGEHVERALALLATGPRGGQRAALLAVLERGARSRPEELVARLPGATPELARELFALLRSADPTRAVDAAFGLLDHPDPDFQLELLEIVGTAPAGVRLAQALHRLMGSPHEAVRIRAADLLGQRGGERAFAPLAARAKKLGATLSPAEAKALGRALSVASPEKALELFAEWTRSSGGVLGMLSRFGKDKQLQRMLGWIIVAGLEHCPGAEPTAMLRSVLAGADPALERFGREVMARREATGAQHGA